MMKQKWLITAEILGVKKYVATLEPGPAGKKIVGGYSLLPEEGKAFDSFALASAAVNNIHNLQDRDFCIESFSGIIKAGRP
jgi:hypothetical protein